jgi:hypothetical protein
MSLPRLVVERFESVEPPRRPKLQTRSGRTAEGRIRIARPGFLKTFLNRAGRGYSTVTVFARFRGWSTFKPRVSATSIASI